MIHATIILLYFAFLLWLAYEEAKMDANHIARHEPIDHGVSLVDRLIAGGSIWAIAGMVMFMFTANAWLAVPMAPMGWASWTATFRLRLNAKRGKDWRYVSKSNWYDWQFIKRTRAGITRAGLMAYAFEALVFVLSLVAFIALAHSPDADNDTSRHHQRNEAQFSVAQDAQ